ncbi:cAMP-binding domain of CRP or a regulatory subunit of cAMP-dependent protein kinases [Soonwooa buanensis]|uniref:cAMP-binding domain of CRP or a regulatory subunit of cAMP-dependent protein kinases n=1 Tax=Soonwooa buanensis TaxID=619805 RepID=A0A1T5GU28_9FLAO|nr:Crp/Fnr family transcriptional regulator [Soonwooa buanensis]SKC11917.1 cAMP-binding domain of CRP or a regulatory subunit of cAMP-dependent protein kinases [Soonwooa buanensis]
MNIENIFKHITDKDLPEFEKELITKNFNIQKFRKNQILVKDTDDCDSIFFIVKGAIRIYHFNNFGAEVTRAFIFENEFCTNLISFSNQAPNNENIQCLEDTLTFSITRTDFYNMLSQSHVLTHLYSRILEVFINRHLQHFQFMNTLSERQRIERFLQNSPEINLRVKDKIIATYLGVTPEFFSKIKSEINRINKQTQF